MKNHDFRYNAIHLSIFLILAILSSAGCGGPATPSDAGLRCDPPPTAVDLLLVIDNSSDMNEAQALLIAELPALLAPFAERPELSLQVGVVSTDMGTGGFMFGSCAEPMFGEDAILRRESGGAREACAGEHPAFLRWPGAGADLEGFASELGCLVERGDRGCGTEQPLEAALKAVSPPSAAYPGVPEGYEPPLFFGETRGHAGGENRISPAEPFLREGSLLAVLLLTDEDDCSASDPRLFDVTAEEYSTVGLSFRCTAYADRALHPPARYAEGLLALRPDPRDLVFLVIAGIPEELLEDPGPLDYERILLDPRMMYRNDPVTMRPAPACTSDLVVAFPPKRIVEAAGGIVGGGGRAGLRSICSASFAGALDPLFERLDEAPPPGCE